MKKLFIYLIFCLFMVSCEEYHHVDKSIHVWAEDLNEEVLHFSCMGSACSVKTKTGIYNLTCWYDGRGCVFNETKRIF